MSEKVKAATNDQMRTTKAIARSRADERGSSMPINPHRVLALIARIEQEQEDHNSYVGTHCICEFDMGDDPGTMGEQIKTCKFHGERR